MSRSWRFALAAAAVLIVLGGYLYWRSAAREADGGYVTENVDRGTVASTVTATGTVNPVTTVQVGTYVSGPIRAIYADFNSPVTKGQLRRQDRSRAVSGEGAEADANLANARAKVDKDARRPRVQEAHARPQPRAARQEPDLAERPRHGQEQLRPGAWRSWRSTRPACSRRRRRSHEARINLAYTDITSPVDGVVVSRNVDVGQTVAASFQTPTLFLIAQDLTKMQVDANVSESDIGEVRDGQPASFTRRRVSRPAVSRHRHASAQRAAQRAERRDLRRRHRRRQSRAGAQARHDGDGERSPRRSATTSCASRCARCASTRSASRTPPRRRRPRVRRASAAAPAVWVMQADGTLRKVEVQLGVPNDQYAELTSTACTRATSSPWPSSETARATHAADIAAGRRRASLPVDGRVTGTMTSADATPQPPPWSGGDCERSALLSRRRPREVHVRVDAMAEPLIQVRDLWKIYELGDVEVQALRGVSLDIDSRRVRRRHGRVRAPASRRS